MKGRVSCASRDASLPLICSGNNDICWCCLCRSFFLSLVSSIIFFVMADMVRQQGKKKEKEVACAYYYCNRWHMRKEWRKLDEVIVVKARAKVVDGCVPLSMK